jgi:tRNA (guanine37-N1)-methyltransferase
MQIIFVSAFPDMLRVFFSESMFRRASEQAGVIFEVWDLRDFTSDKHRQIDDKPYGGGAGMIIKPGPFFSAHDRIKEELQDTKPRVIFPSPQGRLFNHSLAVELAQEKNLSFFCGHYKGVDERVIEHLVTDEISIGDFILTGGELPSLLMVDAIIRHVPGVLNSYESAETDSFADNLLEGPIYTTPQIFRGLAVPEVLLSGHHAKIAEWRRQQRIDRTQERRKDLLKNRRSETNEYGGNHG